MVGVSPRGHSTGVGRVGCVVLCCAVVVCCAVLCCVVLCCVVRCCAVLWCGCGVNHQDKADVVVTHATFTNACKLRSGQGRHFLWTNRTTPTYPNNNNTQHKPTKMTPHKTSQHPGLVDPLEGSGWWPLNACRVRETTCAESDAPRWLPLSTLNFGGVLARRAQRAYDRGKLGVCATIGNILTYSDRKIWCLVLV